MKLRLLGVGVNLATEIFGENFALNLLCAQLSCAFRVLMTRHQQQQQTNFFLLAAVEKLFCHQMKSLNL